MQPVCFKDAWSEMLVSSVDTYTILARVLENEENDTYKLSVAAPSKGWLILKIQALACWRESVKAGGFFRWEAELSRPRTGRDAALGDLVVFIQADGLTLAPFGLRCWGCHDSLWCQHGKRNTQGQGFERNDHVAGSWKVNLGGESEQEIHQRQVINL